MNTYCGVDLPDPFHSTGNQLHVTFQSDFSTGGRGFLLDWTAVSALPATPPTVGENTTAGKTVHILYCGEIVKTSNNHFRELQQLQFTGLLKLIWKVMG